MVALIQKCYKSSLVLIFYAMQQALLHVILFSLRWRVTIIMPVSG